MTGDNFRAREWGIRRGGERTGSKCPILFHHLNGQIVQLTGQTGCQLSEHFLLQSNKH